MRRRRMAAWLAGMLTVGAGQAPQPMVTSVPFETLQRCFHAKWAPTGRLTAINTAAGAMLDLGFDSVGDDGKVGTSHAIFSIEDRGAERRVAVSTTNPADAPLARQMLDQTMAACAADAGRR